MFFLRRSRGGPDPHLHHKMLAFAVGAALAMLGIALEIQWLVTVAIALMTLALIATRIARSGRDSPEE